MPIEVDWNGTYSVSRAQRVSVIVSGLDGSAPTGERAIWIGYKTVAGAPTTPADLHASKYFYEVGRFAANSVISLTRRPDGTGRVAAQLVYGGGDMADVAAGNYVWVGITDTDDPTDEFLAVAGPKRARY